MYTHIGEFYKKYIFSGGDTHVMVHPFVMILDHLDQGRSSELMNPCPEWIRRFI